MDDGSNRYARLFGREAAFKGEQADHEEPYVEVFRFGKSELEVPLANWNVYITGGMSAREMILPERLQDKHIPKNIEITAYSESIIETAKGMDFICWILHWLAHFPFREKTFLAATQTFNVGRPIVPDSEMTAYYFAETPIINAHDLFDACPQATGFIHLVPISESERQLAVAEGSKALLTLFDQHEISPLFDLKRPSLV